MKQNLIVIGLALIFSLPILAQNKDSANVVSEERTVASFETIDVTGRFLVKLYPSAKPEVRVVAAARYVSTVETTVENGTLKINMADLTGDKNVSIIDGVKTKYNDYLIRQPIEIRVGVTNLGKMFVNGVTTVETESPLKLQNLYININDASKADLNVEVSGDFTASVSGAAKMEISGKAANSQVIVSGASSFEGKNFPTKNTKVSLSGASRAEVYASESLDADLKGATKLVCTGSPKSIKQNASRGSSITVK